MSKPTDSSSKPSGKRLTTSARITPASRAKRNAVGSWRKPPSGHVAVAVQPPFANTDRLPEYTIAREASSATGTDRAGNAR
jgi:hypothetical protein